MSNKKVLAQWRVFCRETNKIQNISPELKKALLRADNIRMTITRELIAKERKQ